MIQMCEMCEMMTKSKLSWTHLTYLATNLRASQFAIAPASVERLVQEATAASEMALVSRGFLRRNKT